MQSVKSKRTVGEMSLPQKEEYGVEPSAWNGSDTPTGVPIKKRRFIFRRSPSPPPCYSTTVAADNCGIQTKEAPFPAPESSACGVSGQVPETGCVDFRDSSLECSGIGVEVNLAQNHGSCPSISEGLLFTLGTTPTTSFGNEGKLISENIPAVRSILGTIPEKLEFRSTLGEGNSGNKLVLSDKSAFQRVLANTELPLPLNRQCEPSLGEPTALVGPAKEGQPSSCKLELTLSESQSSRLSKQTDSELGSSYENQHSNRSNWDLNTTMDTWVRSTVYATLNHREGGDNKDLGLEYIHCKRPVMDPVENSCEASTGIHVIPGKCALTENACSLKLPNILKPANGNPGINTDLNLQLNTAFESIPLSNLGVPFAPPIPSSHRVFDSSLSVKPIILTQSPKLASCDAVKPEPMEDTGSNKNIGMNNFKPVSRNIIKSEALDIVELIGVKTMCPNGVRTAGGSVKLEQLEVPGGEGPRTTEGKAHYHGCDSNAHETVNTGETHHGKDEGAAMTLDLVAQDLIVDYKKLHDIPGAPNAATSHVMGESFNKAVPLVGAKRLVPNDTKLDLGKDMPSNVAEPHGAISNIDSSSNIISVSVISDVNDSHNAHLMPMGVVLQEAKENITKAPDVFSASTAVLCDELSQAKGSSEVAEGTPSVLLDLESREQTDVNHMPGIIEQISYPDTGTQLPAYVPMDVQTPIDNRVTESDAKGEMKEPELCKIVNEPSGSHEAVCVKEMVPKPHGYDDEYEDGEFRESLLRDATKGLCNPKEKKNANIKEGVKSDVPLRISSTVSENESKLQNPDESKDVHCTMESESHLCTEKDDVGLNMAEDVKESSAIEKPISESSKKKSAKVSRKMPQELGKEDSESKPAHKKMLYSGSAKSLDITHADLGSQQAKTPADQSGASKTGVSQPYDAAKRVKSRSDRSYITHLSSSSNAYSGRIKSSHSRSSSRSERERIKDKLVRREKIHMKSPRDESHIRRMQRPGKERDTDQTLRKAGSDGVHMRGRIVQQLDSLRDNWNPDHGYASDHFNMSTSSQHSRPKNASEVAFTVGMDAIFESAGRTGKKHADDELCRPPPRRPSPGGSGPLPVGVQMVRRTMRDISPGRCTEEGIPELVMLNREGKLMRGFADDMVNPSLILRTRPNYEPGRNCLIRSERSLSPFHRRAAPHVSNMSFASSTRSRARSPHLWSPSRRPPDVFDGHPDLICCRSPDLRVERMRSPGERACFQDNILGRRHISPHIAQLHGEMADVNLMRGHDLPKPGRHPQGNLRRFDLIDHRVNPDNFGHLQSGQFRGLEEDDVYAEERRNSDEGHGLARPFRQHYIVGDDVGNDASFHHRVEDIPPRPIRLCRDADEELPGRGISRVGSIRNRLGNMQRRLRGMNEPEDSYRHDNGQGWRGSSFKDVRLKRGRF